MRYFACGVWRCIQHNDTAWSTSFASEWDLVISWRFIYLIPLPTVVQCYQIEERPLSHRGCVIAEWWHHCWLHINMGNTFERHLRSCYIPSFRPRPAACSTTEAASRTCCPDVAQPAGFEPARVLPNWFMVKCSNHSAEVAALPRAQGSSLPRATTNQRGTHVFWRMQLGVQRILN